MRRTRIRLDPDGLVPSHVVAELARRAEARTRAAEIRGQQRAERIERFRAAFARALAVFSFTPGGIR